MHLTPREQEKLMIVVAADRGPPQASARLEVKLRRSRRDSLRRNHGSSPRWPNCRRNHEFRNAILKRDHVMEGVPEMIQEVQVEATFPDGTKLVTIHDPIHEAAQALFGSHVVNHMK